MNTRTYHPAAALSSALRSSGAPQQLFRRVEYDSLNARQQESFNFQKVSAVLADYGFITHPLKSDWKGADFIALHKDGSDIRVQLKGRLTFDKKYLGRDLYVCFPDGADWFFYPHDEFLNAALAETTIESTKSWIEDGNYSFRAIPQNLRQLLEPYRIGENDQQTVTTGTW